MEKVLVIDDSELQRYCVRDIVTRHLPQACEVLEAADGAQGLAMAQRHVPDVIFCDVNMPVMDGFTFVEQLRSTQGISATPVIMITTMSSRNAMRRAMSSGADDYLIKPFSEQELTEALDEQRQRRQNRLNLQRHTMEQLSASILTAVPHELRTPLTSIVSGSELLIKRWDRISKERGVELLGIIHGGAKRLEHTITRYIELVEARSQPVAREPASVYVDDVFIKTLLHHPDLPSLVHGTPDETLSAGFVQNLPALLARIKVRVGPMSVFVAEKDLHRVLLELVGNAIKFASPDSPISLTAQAHAGRFTMQFKNFGHPLPANFNTHMGDFVQVDRDSLEQQGSGLGLSLCKALLSRNGGTMRWVHTHGSPNTLEIDLPLANMPSG